MAIQISGTTVIDNSRNITNAGIVSAIGPINITTVPIYQNNQTISSNYTISSTVNAFSGGPITINNGVTVGITTGGYWKII